MSAAIGQRRASGRWVLLASAVIAVVIHLWGLYRPVGPPIPLWFPAADKVEHLFGFAAPLLLILLCRQSFLRSRGGAGGSSPPESALRDQELPRSFLLVTTAVFLANGVISELFQSAFLPMRSGDPLDVAADWAGCALGVGCFLLLDRRQTASARRSSP